MLYDVFSAFQRLFAKYGSHLESVKLVLDLISGPLWLCPLISRFAFVLFDVVAFLGKEQDIVVGVKPRSQGYIWFGER